MLTNEQFELARGLALRLAGIELVERHHEILSRRHSRLEAGNAGSFDQLLALAEAGDQVAGQKLLSLLTTNVTSFFRHAPHFEIACAHARKLAAQQRHVRCWSAAASTGEEPYSLAIALEQALAPEPRALTIIATDIDSEALRAARRAEYRERDLADLPRELVSRFFKETSPQVWKIDSTLRGLVEFETLNLIDVTWHNISGPFDIIFCRNVLMYLETSHRYSVAERLASLLTPDGLLFLDPAEYLGKAGLFFAPVANGVYSRRRAISRMQNQ